MITAMKSKISQLNKGYHLVKLSNGLPILVVERKDFESASVILICKTGSRNEIRKNNGISHFLEHMFFKGTENRPTAHMVSTILDGIGADFNAFTSKERTAYYIRSAKRHLELAFDLLSDMLLNSKLDKEEIEKEKGVILEEIRMYKDSPKRQVAEDFEELLWGDVPLGWTIAGPEDNIKKMTRKHFTDYLESRYKSQNMLLVVAGNVGLQDSIDLGERYFARVPSGKVANYEKVSIDQAKPKVKVHYKKTDQAHVVIGVKTPKLSKKDRYSLSVMNAILGGGMSSRLFVEVREKRGLAYYVGSSYDRYEDCGVFGVDVGSDVSRVEETVKVVMSEMAKMRNVEVTSEELSKVKDMIEGRIALARESVLHDAEVFASSILSGEPIESAEEYVENIRTVTARDVLEVSKKILLDKYLNLAVIGPYKSEEKFLKNLSFDDIQR